MTLRTALTSLALPVAAAALFVGCPPVDDDDTVVGDVETLDPEPDGAPTEVADGRLTCLGDNAPDDAVGNSLELTGYVRTWADPDADEEPPAAQVEAFSTSGSSLGSAFANTSEGQDGRVSLTVPVTDDGFTGHIVVTHEGFLDLRWQSSRPTTGTDVSGWAFLVTEADRDAMAADLGITLDAGTGILVGAVHDCDSFGVQYAVVTVEGDAGGIYYTSGFDPVADATWSGTSGRFGLPNLAPGAVTVKAWGRSEAGGPLELMSKVDTTIEAGVVTAVALEPRSGLTE